MSITSLRGTERILVDSREITRDIRRATECIQVMSSGHRTIVLAGLAASLAACATLEDKQWSQEAKSASAKAFNVASHSTAKVLQRTQRYLAEQDVLMKFHDAGEHSEKEVLDNHDAHETRRHVAASGD